MPSSHVPPIHLHNGDVVVGEQGGVVFQPLVGHDPLSFLHGFISTTIANVPELVTQVLCVCGGMEEVEVEE